MTRNLTLSVHKVPPMINHNFNKTKVIVTVVIYGNRFVPKTEVFNRTGYEKEEIITQLIIAKYVIRAYTSCYKNQQFFFFAYM